jgi:uncharacterized protein YggU (UPF0235/DUF167 family)
MEALSTRVWLRVAPGATRPGVVGRYGDGWTLRVAAPPEGGRANDAVVGLLAEALDVPRHDVTLVSGHGARDKVVNLSGLGAEEIERRLTSAAENGRR